MATPKFVSVTTLDSGVFSTNLTITKPANVQRGDFLLAFLVTNANASGATPPSGFILLTQTLRGTRYLQTWLKIATNAEPANYTWTNLGTGSNNTNLAALMCYRNLYANLATNTGNEDSASDIDFPTVTSDRLPNMVIGAACSVVGLDNINESVATYSTRVAIDNLLGVSSGSLIILDKVTIAKVVPAALMTYTGGAFSYTSHHHVFRPAPSRQSIL